MKRGMKVWVVFCVHDDVDPFLEFYLTQEQSAVHKPIHSVALNSTLHVSPTICAHEDEFEFVITLQSDIVRLAASSWDQMMEWVESMQSKLREMRILSPKENHYSKMPEQRPILLPTRDPNSPLPLPPLGPSSLLPGVEPVLHSDTDRNNSSSTSAAVLSPLQLGMIAPSTESSEYTRGLQRLVSRVSSLADPPEPPSSPTIPPSPTRNVSNVTVIEVNPSESSKSNQNQSTSPSQNSSQPFNFHLSSSQSHNPSTSPSHNSSQPCNFHPSSSQSHNSVKASTSSSQPTNSSQDSSSSSGLASNTRSSHNALISTNSQLVSTFVTTNTKDSLGNTGQLIPQPSTSRDEDIFSFAFVNETLSSEEPDVFFTPPATPGLPGSIARFMNPLSSLTDPFVPLSSSTDNIAPRTSNHIVDPFAPLESTRVNNSKDSWDNCQDVVWGYKEEELKVWNCSNDGTPIIHPNALDNGTSVSPNGTPLLPSHPVSVSSNSYINVVSTSLCDSFVDIVPFTSCSSNDHSSTLISVATPVNSSQNLSTQNYSQVSKTPPAPSEFKPHNVNVIQNASTTCLPQSTASSNPESCVSANVSRANLAPQNYKNPPPPIPLYSTSKNNQQRITNKSSSKSTPLNLFSSSCSFGQLTPVVSHPKPISASNTKAIPLAVLKSGSSSSNSVIPTSSSSILPPVSKSNSPLANPKSQSKPVSKPQLSNQPVKSSSSASKPSSKSQAVTPPLTTSPPLLPSPLPRHRRNSAEDNDANQNGHNLYEHLFLANERSGNSASESSGNPERTGNSVNEKSGSGNVGESNANSQANNARSRPSTRSSVNSQPNRPRRRSASNSEPSGHLPHVPADRIRVVSQRSCEQLVTPRIGTTPVISTQPASPDAPLVNASRLTLREQQVLQLRREMMHPGGVRLQLKRKDCVNSIALVDAFNAVWIAGWKQIEHPMLYGALHIGDQVLKIMGQPVHNAAEAQKLIRSKHGIYVEFVILRVPRGRVYAICREHQGQSLGIVQEGTAEIRDVLPGSLVHQNGIPQKTTTMDGLGLTTWWITEINGRPLNLFFKDNEVKDRLNCVGIDISLLIQPFDLIKQIKKQMKSSIRSYKDYIVQ